MSNIKLVKGMFADRPTLQRGSRDYGISKEFGLYLSGVVSPGLRTLETGAGISTLIFALGGAYHVAVAPWQEEMDAIRNHARKLGIDMSSVELIAQPSENYLPIMTPTNLDIVFIDGSHAFPWPILDWYYTAQNIKQGGLLMLDDVHLRPVGVLSEFLRADTPRWKFLARAGDTDIFEKTATSVPGISWVEQPWAAPSSWYWFSQRVKRRLRRVFRL